MAIDIDQLSIIIGRNSKNIAAGKSIIEAVTNLYNEQKKQILDGKILARYCINNLSAEQHQRIINQANKIINGTKENQDCSGTAEHLHSCNSNGASE